MEGSEQQIPAVEMERMMKAQEVILKAAAEKEVPTIPLREVRSMKGL